MTSHHNVRFAQQRCGTVVLLIGSLLLTAACAATSPAPAGSVPPGPPVVEPVAVATPADAHCAWVPKSPTDSHALRGTSHNSDGHWEIKICGAPEGDTTGMGGPVDWRFVAEQTG